MFATVGFRVVAVAISILSLTYSSDMIVLHHVKVAGVAIINTSSIICLS